MPEDGTDKVYLFEEKLLRTARSWRYSARIFTNNDCSLEDRFSTVTTRNHWFLEPTNNHSSRQLTASRSVPPGALQGSNCTDTTRNFPASMGLTATGPLSPAFRRMRRVVSDLFESSSNTSRNSVISGFISVVLGINHERKKAVKILRVNFWRVGPGILHPISRSSTGLRSCLSVLRRSSPLYLQVTSTITPICRVRCMLRSRYILPKYRHSQKPSFTKRSSLTNCLASCEASSPVSIDERNSAATLPCGGCCRSSSEGALIILVQPARRRSDRSLLSQLHHR